MGQPPQTLAIILLSVGAFTYAKHPEGVLEFQKRRSLDKVQKQIDRFQKRDQDASSGGAIGDAPDGNRAPAPAGGAS